MLHNDPPPAKRAWTSDDEVRSLLHRAARRGPWHRARIFVAMVLMVLLVGGAVWWFWPRSVPPLLTVIAFDRVALANKATTLRAATEPLDGSDMRWGGSEVFFEEAGGQAAGASGKTRKATTDQSGVAEIDWQFPPTPYPVNMEVRYIDEHQQPPWSSRDHGRVFVWGKDSRIIVLDIEPWLNDPKDWPPVAEALTAAADKGWRIVYLGVGPDRPTVYQKMRALARRLMVAERGQGPECPVLARKSFYPRKTSPDVSEILADLRRDFPGPLLYLDTAQHIQLSRVGEDGHFIGHPLPVPAWEALVESLPQ
jgi:hypothetical protein